MSLPLSTTFAELMTRAKQSLAGLQRDTDYSRPSLTAFRDGLNPPRQWASEQEKRARLAIALKVTPDWFEAWCGSWHVQQQRGGRGSAALLEAAAPSAGDPTPSRGERADQIARTGVPISRVASEGSSYVVEAGGWWDASLRGLGWDDDKRGIVDTLRGRFDPASPPSQIARAFVRRTGGAVIHEASLREKLVDGEHMGRMNVATDQIVETTPGHAKRLAKAGWGEIVAGPATLREVDGQHLPMRL